MVNKYLHWSPEEPERSTTTLARDSTENVLVRLAATRPRQLCCCSAVLAAPAPQSVFRTMRTQVRVAVTWSQLRGTRVSPYPWLWISASCLAATVSGSWAGEQLACPDTR